MRRRRARNESGQALAESPVSLVLVFLATALGALFLANAGTTTLSKEKLGLITNQAASFAANAAASKSIPDVANDTSTKVNSLVRALSLPASPVQVTVSPITIGIMSAVKVSISASNLPLLGLKAFYPSGINLTDSAVAVIQGPPSGEALGYIMIDSKSAKYSNGAQGATKANANMLLVPYLGFTGLSRPIFQSTGAQAYKIAAPPAP